MGAILSIPMTTPDGYELIGGINAVNQAMDTSFSVNRVYQDLIIYVTGTGTGTYSTGITYYIVLNGDTASTSYSYRGWFVNSAALTAWNGMSAIGYIFAGNTASAYRSTTVIHGTGLHIAGAKKLFQCKSAYLGGTGAYTYLEGAYFWNNTADPISTIRLYGSRADNINYDFHVFGKR